MHASWNALLKGGSDRLRSVTVMAVTTSVVAGLAAFGLPTSGATIAAYTLADGLGARLSGHSQAYTAWLFVSYGPAMLLILILWRGHTDHFRLDAEGVRSAMEVSFRWQPTRS